MVEKHRRPAVFRSWERCLVGPSSPWSGQADPWSFSTGASLAGVQTDVPSARFVHGPSSRNCATTWPPFGPAHWC